MPVINGNIVEDHIIAPGIILAVLTPFVVILNIPPLIWHLRNRNMATIFMVLWVMVFNFFGLINIIIWPYINTSNMYSGEGLCDFEAKLMIARTTGLNGAIFCLLRALSAALDTEKTLLGPTKSQKRKNTCIELTWCVGIPVMTMVFHYIVQPNRFVIVGVSGCQATLSDNWLSFYLIWLPPILINVVAAYYAVLIVIRLCKYRSSFNSIMASSNSTRSRFLRLFAIALLGLFGITPLQIYLFAIHIPRNTDPNDFATIHNHPMWNSTAVLSSHVFYDSWINLASGFILFIFFGLGRDAKDMYRDWLVSLGLARFFPWLTSGFEIEPKASRSSSSELPLVQHRRLGRSVDTT